MSKRFTVAVTALFSASEQAHCALVVYAILNAMFTGEGWCLCDVSEKVPVTVSLSSYTRDR